MQLTFSQCLEWCLIKWSERLAHILQFYHLLTPQFADLVAIQKDDRAIVFACDSDTGKLQLNAVGDAAKQTMTRRGCQRYPRTGVKYTGESN
jgi:hypothetical protein